MVASTLIACFAALAATPQADPKRPAIDPYDLGIRASVYVVANVNYRVAKGGTGFLVDRAHKLLITNHHVVSGSTTVWVYFPRFEDGVAVASRKYYGQHDRPIFGRVLADDARRDLAIVELDMVTPQAQALVLAQAGAWPGETVAILGNPGNSKFFWAKNSATVTNVRHRHLRYSGGEELSADMVQLKPKQPTGPGYSGSPLLNQRGQVVGIISGAAHFGSETLGIDVIDIRDILALARAHAREQALLRPESAADYAARGFYYQRKHRYEGAAADFTEALRRDPRNPILYRERGLALLADFDLLAGLADLDRAVRLERNEGTQRRGPGVP
jgi:tetratricopeptide (TPR) repeat protein